MIAQYVIGVYMKNWKVLIQCFNIKFYKKKINNNFFQHDTPHVYFFATCEIYTSYFIFYSKFILNILIEYFTFLIEKSSKMKVQ